MHKFVRNSLLFLPVAVIGYLLLLALLGDLGWVRTAITQMGNTGHICSRVKDIRNYHNVEVLFLGSTALSTPVSTKPTAFLASISAPPTKRLSKLTPSCKTISTASTPSVWCSKCIKTF